MADFKDSPIQVRPAQIEDLEPIMGLWGGMMLDHQHADPRIRLSKAALPSYRAYAGFHINNSESRVLVACCEERVIGFCLLTICRNLPMFLPSRYGYLSDLMVSERWRRRGAGRMLVEAGAQWLRQHGVDSIQLQYYCFNQTGERFWRAMGFEPFYTRAWLNL